MKKLLFILFLLPFLVDGQTSSTNSPGTMADDASVGTVAWSNPDNAKSSDNVYATATGAFTNKITHYLKATNFGFSIPSEATINGILVEVERKSAINFVSDGSASNAIIKADGSLKHATYYVEWSTTEQYDSYGSSTDLWGETWTAADINDVDFGFALYAKLYGGEAGAFASVDHIRITVYYTEISSAYKKFGTKTWSSVKKIAGVVEANIKKLGKITKLI